ncbi:hypothetical protein EDC01DRAFT_591488, partial [Geopyxis carbonaria]
TPAERLYIYGDAAYSLSFGVSQAYKAGPNQPLHPVLKEINAVMSGMRTSVENGFGKTMMLWGFNGYKNDLKSRLSPVAAYFMNAVFLSNIHSCVYGNPTSQRFQCAPPSLREYL